MIEQYYQEIENFLGKLIGMPQLTGLIVGAIASILTTLIFYIIYRVANRVLLAAEKKISAYILGKGPLRFQQQQIFSGDDLGKIAGWIARGFRIAVMMVLFFLYLNAIFSFFAITRGFVASVFEYLGDAMGSMLLSILNYLPNLFVVVIILLIVKYLLKLINLMFDGIKDGRINVPGFYPEWSRPTFNILKLIVYAFTLVIIFPYLPGSSSPAFQGVSIFLGVLLSLGSTAAVSNVVAGIVITYTRAFKVGDRVRIASADGTVTEKTLFVTRLRTSKNMDIAIPNSMVLANHILNYTSQTETHGLILHTTITIGYDIPWRQVHQLLAEAAQKTDLIEVDPEPFVLQKSLDDFSVAYELNAYTRHSRKMPLITSHLHENIQDVFGEAGIEIMSPHFTAVRDGADTTLPEEHIPSGYEPTPFRIHPFENILPKTKK